MRTTIGSADSSQMSALVSDLGRHLMVNPTSVMPFLEFDDLMPELLQLIARGRHSLVCGGHATPHLLLAAHKAEMSVDETLSVSPFTLDAATIKKALTTPADILYIANPNRVTGANLGLTDLKYLAEAIPNGFLIIDEYYYDYYGISGMALLAKYSNVIVLRSATALLGLGTSETGYVVASPTIIEHLVERFAPARIPASTYSVLSAALKNDQSLGIRLRLLHDEMLRVSTVLTRLGIQNRITAADFLLLRVASPVNTGNYLARYRIPFDNLDGYPQLTNYLRYKMQAEVNNDELITAFQKMPQEYYRMIGVDTRAVTIRRAGESLSFERSGTRSGLSDRLGQRSFRTHEVVAK